MLNENIRTRAHTSPDGILNLTVNVGVCDADVTVLLQVLPAGFVETDENGWPKEYFEKVPGSMPLLTRHPQGESDQRAPYS